MIFRSVSSVLDDNETNSLKLYSFSWLAKLCQTDRSRGKGISFYVGQLIGWVQASKHNSINIPWQKEEGVTQLDGFSW